MEQNNPHQNQTFMSIRELTISGLLAGITIFLGLTGYGFVPLVVMNATILHIPTIIGTVRRRAEGRHPGRIPFRALFFHSDAARAEPDDAVRTAVQCHR